MDTLQQLFETTLTKTLSEERVIVHILLKKFREQGFVLSSGQIKELEQAISQTADISAYKFDEDEALETPEDLTAFRNGGVRIEIDHNKDLAEAFEEIAGNLSNSLPEIAVEVSAIIFDTLKKNFKQYQKHARKENRQFCADLEHTWGTAFDLLEMFYDIALESGNSFNDYYWPKAAKEGNPVYDVLAGLHANGCRICAEIICLLKNGYADGAHARWRTLHEMAVIAAFVRGHGNDVAERYLYHGDMEEYGAARRYRARCRELGGRELEEGEYAALRDNYLALAAKYGRSYENRYGWAAAALGTEDPALADLEAGVDPDYLRPYYTMAGHGAADGPRALFSRVGLLPQTSEISLSGPGNPGLADPGHGTAISLLHITSSLLTVEANLDRLVICNVLSSLEGKIGEAFHKAYEAVEEAGAA
ncbi:hypothetical protein FO488_04625 [Geobacter sp. FeAm09]|uniref:DUF5677 domain-containing protein n=1 Tax=Geobacter sp. FeAm09 TaxID=2597769 RepID=UPI0011ED8C66|nr:DUF5677 domain-containing protein [Geobacter sp. FeAm09]QEM67500.1 hypothetical protein FO488_04625 [Geobacter sp. FeAm09]